MKVGDLVIHNNVDIGVITHVFDDNEVCVLFEDGEYQVDSRDCVVVSEKQA